jgi:hypothetical protein
MRHEITAAVSNESVDGSVILPVHKQCVYMRHEITAAVTNVCCIVFPVQEQYDTA